MSYRLPQLAITLATVVAKSEPEAFSRKIVHFRFKLLNDKKGEATTSPLNSWQHKSNADDVPLVTCVSVNLRLPNSVTDLGSFTSVAVKFRLPHSVTGLRWLTAGAITLWRQVSWYFMPWLYVKRGITSASDFGYHSGQYKKVVHS